MTTPCVLSKNGDRWNYDRCFHQAERALSQQIAKSYGKEQAAVTASGNNALFYIMMGSAKHFTYVFYGDELYCDTPRQMTDLFKERKVKHIEEFSVLLSIDAIIDQMKSRMGSTDEHVIIVIESCTNPSGHMIDFENLKKIKQTFSNCLIVVDNTWLSSALFNPFDYDADIVYESLSKYNSGGTRIGGVIVFRNETDEITKKIMNKIKSSGLHIEVDVCQHFSSMFANLVTRVEKSSKSTLSIAQQMAKLVDGKKFIDIIYPGLESHIHHERVKKLCKGVFPSVFLVQVIAQSKTKVFKMLEESNIWCATSYGGSKSRCDPYFSPPGRDKVVTLRFACGHNDASEFLNNLLQFLKNL
jgi:O-succinylhomoserine sulfhydrylase